MDDGRFGMCQQKAIPCIELRIAVGIDIGPLRFHSFRMNESQLDIYSLLLLHIIHYRISPSILRSTSLLMDIPQFSHGEKTSNVFIATVIVIPKQIGTSDTCTPLNEEETISLADAEKLYMIGWVSVIST